MRYLDRFTGYIKEYEKTYPLPTFDKSMRHMESVAKEIDEKLKDAALGEPNPELVQQTLKKFFDWSLDRTTEEFNWLEVALLCRGLLVDTPENGALIQSRVAFKVFLERFIRLHQEYAEYAMSAYCWQGLLNTYLNTSPRQEPSVADNWQALRLFLQETLDTIADQSRFKPRWLDALIEHRIVLAENATQSLAQEALQGRLDRVNRIADEVNIPPTSWFWPELLMSQIEVLTTYHDEPFKESIDMVLPQLQKRKEYLDDGLAKILDRYAKCANLERHQELKTQVVSRWKSPSLEKQRDWERVSTEAKRMVQRWLAQEDITEILGELVEDNRRYEFWLQFLDQIEYTFVWLGKEARESFPHLLHNRKDRCAVLNHTGRPDNNVILMKIHDIFIIESGARAGGKCWAYRAEKIVPLLQKSHLSYENFRDHRKNLFTNGWGESDGLVHVSGTWEKTFKAELARFHIKPDPMSFDEVIDRYQLRLESLPSGTEIIRHKYSTGTLASLLIKNGFSSNSKEGIYYRSAQKSSHDSKNKTVPVGSDTETFKTQTPALGSRNYQDKISKVNNKEEFLTLNEILGRHHLRIESMAKGWERVRYHESDGFLADLLRQNGFELRKDQNYYRSPRTK